MQPRPLCIYQTGSALQEVRDAHGDFPSWFERLLAGAAVAPVVHVADAAPAPDPRGFAGILVTGSPRSLVEPEPWMEDAIELVRMAADVGTPVLGVCFGHQLIGAAFGGAVVRNAAGWEVATRTVELTSAGRADPLFAGLGPAITVNQSHQDVVEADTLSPRNGVRILARNGKSSVQAVAAGDSVRGVQFHPEFTGEIARAYLRARYQALASDAEERGAAGDHPAELLATARDCPDGEQVFANFLRAFVRQA